MPKHRGRLARSTRKAKRYPSIAAYSAVGCGISHKLELYTLYKFFIWRYVIFVALLKRTVLLWGRKFLFHRNICVLKEGGGRTCGMIIHPKTGLSVMGFTSAIGRLNDYACDVLFRVCMGNQKPLLQENLFSGQGRWSFLPVEGLEKGMAAPAALLGDPVRWRLSFRY